MEESTTTEAPQSVPNEAATPEVVQGAQQEENKSTPSSQRERIQAVLAKQFEGDAKVSEDSTENKPTGKSESNDLDNKAPKEEEPQEASEEQESDDTNNDEADDQGKQEKPKRRRVAPPKHFTPEQREMFDAQPDGLKDLWKTREKELGGAANALHSENLQQKEKLESYKQYDDVLKLADKEAKMITSLRKAQGLQGEVDAGMLVKNLLNFHKESLEHPLRAIQKLADSTGVDLKEMVTGDASLAYDKLQNQYTRQLAMQQAEIAELRAQQQQVQQQTQQQSQQQQFNAALQEVNAITAPILANVPTEYHSELEELAAARLGVLARGNPGMPKKELIERSVNDAIYSIPELRQQKLQEQQAAGAAARAKRVQESKQMAVSPSSRTSRVGGVGAKGGSVRDQVARNVEKFGLFG